MSADGSIEVVVGTGALGASEDGMRATEVGILPTDSAFEGALLFSQSQPDPAVAGSIRRRAP